MDKSYPLDGHGFGNDHVTLAPMPAMSRISLRAGTDATPSLSKALGLALPETISAVSVSGARAALKLGPDEFLVLDGNGAGLAAACGTGVFSAVDVSERNVAIEVTGPRAATALNAACPLDLSAKAFPVGTARRTIFGKAEIVLWRKGEQEWHVECWRSFSPYVFGLLEEGARDAAVCA